jgi:hypothetical protein
LSSTNGVEADNFESAKAALQTKVESLHTSAEYARAIEALEGYWNFDNLIERKKALLEVILDSLAFEDGEFEGFKHGLDERVEEELLTRRDVIVAEYQRYRS